MFGPLQILRRLRVGDVDQVSEPVIILGPIHEADVAGVSPFLEILPVGDAAIGPEVQRPRRAGADRIEGDARSVSLIGSDIFQLSKGPGQAGFIVGT